MQDYAERLMYANTTLTFIRRAFFQEERVQEAHRGLTELDDQLEQAAAEGKPAPLAWSNAEVRVTDELYYLVVALRQVIRGREIMSRLGFEVPEFRQSELIGAWRDIEEHWDDPAPGIEIRAIKRWRGVSDHEEPGMTRTFTEDEILTASGLELESVREDLKALQECVGQISEDEWDLCHITPAEAAEILGVAEEELPGLAFHRDFGGDFGVRYWREAVEARKEGHMVPPRWVAEGWVTTDLGTLRDA